jgi:hypothetical protein
MAESRKRLGRQEKSSMLPWPPNTDMAMRMMSVLSQLAAIFWSMMSSRTAKRLFLISGPSSVSRPPLSPPARGRKTR